MPRQQRIAKMGKRETAAWAGKAKRPSGAAPTDESVKESIRDSRKWPINMRINESAAPRK